MSIYCNLFVGYIFANTLSAIFPKAFCPLTAVLLASDPNDLTGPNITMSPTEKEGWRVCEYGVTAHINHRTSFSFHTYVSALIVDSNTVPNTDYFCKSYKFNNAGVVSVLNSEHLSSTFFTRLYIYILFFFRCYSTDLH